MKKKKFNLGCFYKLAFLFAISLCSYVSADNQRINADYSPEYTSEQAQKARSFTNEAVPPVMATTSMMVVLLLHWWAISFMAFGVGVP